MLHSSLIYLGRLFIFRPLIKKSIPKFTKLYLYLSELKNYAKLTFQANIAKIARKGIVQTGFDEGTVCHFCKEKTSDQKTYCSSSCCVGKGEHFCGVCLINRYKEDIAVAIKDPLWKCPLCRRTCNCLFCYQEAVTSAQVSVAQQITRKSANDQQSLEEKEDNTQCDSFQTNLNDHRFVWESRDLKPLPKLGEYTREDESMTDLDDAGLMGFFKGTNVALLDDGSICDMSGTATKYNISKKKLNADVVIKTEPPDFGVAIKKRKLDTVELNPSNTGLLDSNVTHHLDNTKGQIQDSKNVARFNKSIQEIDDNDRDAQGLLKGVVVKKERLDWEELNTSNIISGENTFWDREVIQNLGVAIKKRKLDTVELNPSNTGLLNRNITHYLDNTKGQIQDSKNVARFNKSIQEIDDNDRDAQGLLRGVVVKKERIDWEELNTSNTISGENTFWNREVIQNLGIIIKRKKLDCDELRLLNTVDEYGKMKPQSISAENSILDREGTPHLGVIIKREKLDCDELNLLNTVEKNEKVKPQSISAENNILNREGTPHIGVVVKKERIDWEELNTSNTISGENTFWNREVIQNLGIIIKRKKLDCDELRLLNTVDEYGKMKPQSISAENSILDREGTPHLGVIIKREKLDCDELNLLNTVEKNEKVKPQSISAENNILNREGTPHIGVVVKKERIDWEELNTSNTISGENTFWNREVIQNLGIIIKRKKLDCDELRLLNTVDEYGKMKPQSISAENSILDREGTPHLGVIIKREKLDCGELNLLNTVEKNEKVKPQSISAENNILNSEGTPHIGDIVKKEKLGYDELSPSNTQSISGDNILDGEGTPHSGVMIKKEQSEFDEINTSNTIQENAIVDGEVTQHSDGNQDFRNVSRSSECVQNIENANNNDNEGGYLRGMYEYILEDGTVIVFNAIELLN